VYFRSLKLQLQTYDYVNVKGTNFGQRKLNVSILLLLLLHCECNYVFFYITLMVETKLGHGHPIPILHGKFLARLVDVQPLGVLRRHTDVGEDDHLVGTAVRHPQESAQPAIESLLDVRDVVHPAAVLQTQLPHSRVEAQSKGAQQNGQGIGHEQQRGHEDLVQVRPLLAIIVEHVVPGESSNVEGVHRRDDGDERQAEQRDEQDVEAGATAASAAQVAALLGIAGHCMGIQLLQLLATDVDL